MAVELEKEFAVGLVRYLATRPYNEVYQAVAVLTTAIEEANTAEHVAAPDLAGGGIIIDSEE